MTAFQVHRIHDRPRDATEPMVHEKGDNTEHPIPHALALALLAALEAEQ